MQLANYAMNGSLASRKAVEGKSRVYELISEALLANRQSRYAVIFAVCRNISAHISGARQSLVNKVGRKMLPFYFVEKLINPDQANRHISTVRLT